MTERLIDPTDINTRVHLCGCVDRYVGAAGLNPPGWVHFDRCEQHKEGDRG